jgi:hypothetical protein
MSTSTRTIIHSDGRRETITETTTTHADGRVETRSQSVISSRPATCTTTNHSHCSMQSPKSTSSSLRTIKKQPISPTSTLQPHPSSLLSRTTKTVYKSEPTMSSTTTARTAYRVV